MPAAPSPEQPTATRDPTPTARDPTPTARDPTPTTEPPPVPAGDTLEVLPEGFWGSPDTPAEAPEPTPPNPADAAPRVATPEPVAPAPAATPAVAAADQTESLSDAGSTGVPGGGTIATLQRLFPGRVLRVEADEPTLGLGADVEEDAANTTATADRESPDSGLESRGSRDT